MRVLVISAAFPPLVGGEADHMLHLSRRLAERGLEVHLLTMQGREANNSFPFTVHPVMRDWSWSDLPRLIKFMMRYRPHGILLKYSGWLYSDHPMITFAPTLAKFLLPNCHFITQFGFAEGSHPEWKTPLVRKVLAAITLAAGKKDVDYQFGTLLRDSDSLIALGELYGAMLVKRLPAAQRKMMVIPPPAILYMIEEKGGESRKLGRERLGLGAQDFVVAYFGVIYRSKGLETLLQAFQKVAARRKDVKLALIGGQTSVLDGDSYFKEICELSRQLGIADRIVARDYQWDSTDGSLFLRAADVCVLPFDDGVTLIRSSLAGAAAHGLPIITTKGDILESPFVDGKNVLLCRPKDPESLAAAMESVISNPELRRRLADGAFEMSREWFSWDNAIDRTVAALAG